MRIAFFIIALALLPKALELLFQKRFPVHSTGGIVVTGASSGIGFHTTRALVDHGYTVFAGVRKAADAERLQQQIPGVVPILLDVAKQPSIDAAKAFITTRLLALDRPLVGLVNNAGVQLDLPVEFQSPSADRFTFDVNVFGLLDTTRAFLPLLRQTPGARIVNLGSLAGIVASPGSATYVASKFAVEGITDALRMELAPFELSVSLLQPGYVFTQIGAKLHDNTPPLYGLEPEQHAVYQHVFDGFFKDDKEHAREENASPASAAVDAIMDAVTSATPKTRYQVANVGGIPAWVVGSVKALLPDRAMDALQ